jgi:uncharacterized protein
MRQAGEPSVEEILDSIKKVIARDNRADAADLRTQRESAGIPLTADPVENVVDEEDENVLDLSGDTEFAETEASEEVINDSPLVTEDARVSMQDNFAALAMLSDPGVPPQIVRSGETSLEGLTRELLRPAIAEWLEHNLPPLVERMVAAEISRITGKRG